MFEIGCLDQSVQNLILKALLGRFSNVSDPLNFYVNVMGFFR